MTTRYHLTAAEIAALPATLSIHPVNPDARRTISSPGDTTGLTTLGVNIFTVAPGDKSTEYHVHACEDAAVYVLRGIGTARTGDDTHPVGPGDFIGYPKGGPAHEICNTGDGSTGEKIMAEVGVDPGSCDNRETYVLAVGLAVGEQGWKVNNLWNPVSLLCSTRLLVHWTHCLIRS